MPDNLRVPPHSDEAESSILGAILIDKEAITQVASFLLPEHFYNLSNGSIYQACLDLYQNRQAIDLVTLREKLKGAKTLKQIGGSTYLAGLIDSVPSSAHIEEYAKIVKDNFTKRELITASARINEIAFDDGKEAAEILDSAEQMVFGLSQKHLSQVLIPIKDVLAESFDRLDELHKTAGGLRGVPTGFRDLDNALAGFQNSNLIIMAARPGVGKTALAINMAQNIAVKKNFPVAIFSLEMSKEELLDRILVSQADIDAWRLKTGKLNEDDFSKLSEAMGVLYETPMYIDDTPAASILEIRTKARRMMAEHGLNLIIIDYLQLIKPFRRYESRVQEVSEISQGLKNLARELKIPVLAVSQLSRDVEKRGTRRPQLADLRESGAIEQDADVVMFLYREDEDDLVNVNLEIAKHRNGPLARVPLHFRGDRIRFTEVDTKREK